MCFSTRYVPGSMVTRDGWYKKDIKTRVVLYKRACFQCMGILLPDAELRIRRRQLKVYLWNTKARTGKQEKLEAFGRCIPKVKTYDVLERTSMFIVKYRLLGDTGIIGGTAEATKQITQNTG